MTPAVPIELAPGGGTRFSPDGAVAIADALLEALAGVVATSTDADAIGEASRDWWPLALHWALAGNTPQRAAAVCRPTSTAEVADVLAVCSEHGVPVTAAGGRSGVCGASVPAHGGVVVDLTAMSGIVAVDETSGLVEVLAGTFGPELEDELQSVHGLTVRHFPQSFDISTVGGWVACRGAGQYSTRYGKIEDLVAGLEVVLADGAVVRTGAFPAGADGPDLTRWFLGSEGTLGIVTRVWLRARPVPPASARSAWSFDDFDAGIEACRRIIRRGATPAVLRLYDGAESARSHDGDGRRCTLLVLDEGDNALVHAVMEVVAEECAEARREDTALVDKWLEHRNDTSGLQALTRKGFVVDTMEVAGPWSALPGLVTATTGALGRVPHVRAATCHLSHSYLDGACLYFTFAATPPPELVESTYVALWDAGQRAVLSAGGNLSHHHGVGLNRARFMGEALGGGLAVLQAVKDALDPHGVMNPGKLGLADPFGPVGWP